MNAKAALRQERREIRDRRKALRAELAQLDEQDRALAEALRVLGDSRVPGGKNGSRPEKRTGRGPDRRPAISREDLARQIEDALRKNPDEEFTAPAMADLLDRAHSSTQNAMEDLHEQHRATLVRRGPRGGPVLKFKPTAVEAGRGVRS